MGALNKKEKGLMDMDKSVAIAEGRRISGDYMIMERKYNKD